jgi:hypothetical protein
MDAEYPMHRIIHLYSVDARKRAFGSCRQQAADALLIDILHPEHIRR